MSPLCSFGRLEPSAVEPVEPAPPCSPPAVTNAEPAPSTAIVPVFAPGTGIRCGHVGCACKALSKTPHSTLYCVCVHTTGLCAGKGGRTPSKRRSSKGPCSITAKERLAQEAEAAALKAAQKEAAVCEKELIVSGPAFGLSFQVRADASDVVDLWQS